MPSPSLPQYGFATTGPGTSSRRRLAGSRLGWLGNHSHSNGKMALFDSSIFHAGSMKRVRDGLMWPAKASASIHSQG